MIFERRSGKSWIPLGSATTDREGYAAKTVTGLKTTQSYRARFVGVAQYVSSESPIRSVRPMVRLTRTTSWSLLYRSRTYYAKGYVEPAHVSSDPNRITIRAYKQAKDGSYKYVRSFAAGFVPISAAKTGYQGRVRFTLASDRGTWKLVAYHAPDSRNDGTYGSPDYVVVK